MIYLAALPFVGGDPNVFDTNGIGSDAERFLTGVEAGTTSYWLRWFAIAVGLVLLFCVPRKNKVGGRSLKIRTYCNFIMFMLYFYAFCLSLTFGVRGDFFWLQPLVYSLLIGVCYMSNSWTVRHGK